MYKFVAKLLAMRLQKYIMVSLMKDKVPFWGEVISCIVPL